MFPFMVIDRSSKPSAVFSPFSLSVSLDMADPEVLPEPDASDECDVCSTDVEDAPGEKIMRCSVCKDRFYCVRRLSVF
jgi:hypothetical protein